MEASSARMGVNTLPHPDRATSEGATPARAAGQGGLNLLGLGHFHPENVIDNPFLEELDIGTSDSWILERVGIRTRRTVLPLDYIRDTRNRDLREAQQVALYSNAVSGARAARMALERAGIEPHAIGMVIAGGCSPQHTTPAEACTIAAELGISAPCFDIASACSSFAAHLHFLAGMQTAALPDYVLTVNVENTTRTVDYTDRNTAVLWGDGTAAAVISPRHPGRLRVGTSLLRSDPANWQKVIIPTGGYFDQNGPAVQGFAIRKTGECVKDLRTTLTGDDFWFVGHQANLLMLESVVTRAGIDPERHLYNVHDYGNCGAAGAPSVLSQNWDRFQGGDQILLAVVGAGLTWGAVTLEVTQA
ncbi:MAG: ketoacyl-ACP synthase III [Spirochaeta sp.]|jgi:3-oxoacyl-[acyl-carrier-protein] synthase-3|nr:ketoacyl-ACP synthase III [Spirochaeta sp.]